jgi:hypothetical protein
MECGMKKQRRDRVLAHILYAHLGLKPWVCPLWCVCVR